MKKRVGIICLIVLFLVVGGILMINNYWGDQRHGSIMGPPEGYEEPGGRVERLKIESSISKYYDDQIDLVALGPGSGWLKLKTRDGISPTLSFKRVSQRDVQRFNRFSQSLGLPVRAEFSDNVLRLSAEVADEGEDTVFVADNEEDKTYTDLMPKDFYGPEEPTRLVIRRDQRGKVFLVKAKEAPKGTPQEIPVGEEFFIAQGDKDKAAR